MRTNKNTSKTPNKHDETQYPDLDTYDATRAIYKLTQGIEDSLDPHL